MRLRRWVKQRVVLFLKAETRVLLTEEIVATVLIKHVLRKEWLWRGGLVIQLRRFYHQIV